MFTTLKLPPISRSLERGAAAMRRPCPRKRCAPRVEKFYLKYTCIILQILCTIVNEINIQVICLLTYDFLWIKYILLFYYFFLAVAKLIIMLPPTCYEGFLLNLLSKSTFHCYRGLSDCMGVRTGLTLYWCQRLITFGSSRISH